MHLSNAYALIKQHYVFYANHRAPPSESVPPQHPGSADDSPGVHLHRPPSAGAYHPIRRCNLACEYCNEYDDFSKPVPTKTMFQRVDKLADLGTSVITISGGEPLLHPELDQIIGRARKRGMIAGLITNGYLLVAERIERLNRAGLEWLQISIDNVTPDEVSKKSLKVLDKKLELLAEYADFHVNINSVVGGGVRNPQDALTIGKRALGLGFSSTIASFTMGLASYSG